ncbi:MAG: sulfatase [Phycisphaerales bacterium]|jgi:arylsulfatase A-like enzyme|nr:sulfatase [Phycisphaerales bacterium]
MISRRQLLRNSAVALAASAAPSFANPATKPNPVQNVLWILVDDLGSQDLGCYGAEFNQTPRIDAFAKESLKFTNGYSAHPVCTPTRASVQTGNNPCRKAINITAFQEMPASQITIAEKLKQQKFRTYYLGKWHLGNSGSQLPEGQGYDVNIAGNGWGQPMKGYYSPWGMKNLPNGPKGEYLTDALTQKSVDLLKTHKAKHAEKPFFMQLAFYQVHTPIQPCKRYLEHFQARRDKFLKEGKLKAKRPSREERGGRTSLQSGNVNFATMLACADESIGKVLDTLKDLGYDKNTLVILIGDNGGLSTLKKRIFGKKRDWPPTCTLPFRAGKGWCYEGGTRIPFLVRIPGMTSAGKASDTPAWTADLYPTTMGLLGLSAPKGQCLDGVDLAPVVANPEAELKRAHPMVWFYPHPHGSGWPGGCAIRDGKWKLLCVDKSWELYDLDTDVAESKNLITSNPAKAKALRGKLEAYLKTARGSLFKPLPE